MVKSISQIIADDPEMSKLLLEIFKWRNCQFSIKVKVNDLAEMIYLKHGIDIEVFT